MPKYKNLSFATRTFYGIEIKPGEVKDFPGYINAKNFIKYKEKPQPEPDPSAPKIYEGKIVNHIPKETPKSEEPKEEVAEEPKQEHKKPGPKPGRKPQKQLVEDEKTSENTDVKEDGSK